MQFNLVLAFVLAVVTASASQPERDLNWCIPDPCCSPSSTCTTGNYNCCDGGGGPEPCQGEEPCNGNSRPGNGRNCCDNPGNGGEGGQKLLRHVRHLNWCVPDPCCSASATCTAGNYDCCDGGGGPEPCQGEEPCNGNSRPGNGRNCCDNPGNGGEGGKRLLRHVRQLV